MIIILNNDDKALMFYYLNRIIMYYQVFRVVSRLYRNVTENVTIWFSIAVIGTLNHDVTWL